jgi:formylglycine-generating enzyme required for sulfatase activity
MVEEKRPLKVFLCHAHSDKEAVRALYLRMKKDGIDAWLDKEKLLPGQDWALEIRRALRETDVVVVCLSKQFTQDGFRQKEVQLALETALYQPEGGIFIIPARLEECDTLDDLRKWHWVDLFEQNGYEMLLRSLRAQADKKGATLQSKRSRPPKVTAQPEIQERIPEKKPDLPVAASRAVKEDSWERHKPNTAIIVAMIGLVGTIIAAIIGSPWLIEAFTSAPGPTATITQAVNPTSNLPAPPTQTLQPAKSQPAPPSLPAVFTDESGVEMLLIPRGEFTMGSNAGGPNETPAHAVYLDNYYIDKFEVTNALYKICEDEGTCLPPIQTIDYRNPATAQHPVVFIDWNYASAYCQWRGARLPTEAEWEKAARGSDGRTYPWGEQINEDYANYDKYVAGGKTTPVGQYESGKSVYGAYDMSGNVWEWVEDWYDVGYYAVSPSSGPSGPRTGEYRVVRGGAFDRGAEMVRGFTRTWLEPTDTNSSVGFRCARDEAR